MQQARKTRYTGYIYIYIFSQHGSDHPLAVRSVGSYSCNVQTESGDQIKSGSNPDSRMLCKRSVTGATLEVDKGPDLISEPLLAKMGIFTSIFCAHISNVSGNKK